MIETAEKKVDRGLLVALDTGDYDVQASLGELEELAKTAGVDPVLQLTQKRSAPESATCLGSGMTQEVKEICQREELNLILFDRELTPTQIRNLENICEVSVIDRTMLILDIFARHARSREGKLQVELAQLRYMLPRLTGKGIELSRLGGGIGTRGPGETKLETDRRHIRRRIEHLKEQLRKTQRVRGEIVKRRKKDHLLTVALVGYTNAGKSTLMNRLTEAGVLAEDKLFATLDPTARGLTLPSGKKVVLIDTVGLIRRLPHHLVEAFRSTLEQVAQADVILNICDASSQEVQVQMEVTEEILQSLGAGERPVIPVLNKWDLVEQVQTREGEMRSLRIQDCVRISAKTGEGIEKLLGSIEENLPETTLKMELLLPFAKSGLAAQLREEGEILREEYLEEGLRITAEVIPRHVHLAEPYQIPGTAVSEKTM